jgi:hypothetical protein
MPADCCQKQLTMQGVAHLAVYMAQHSRGVPAVEVSLALT